MIIKQKIWIHENVVTEVNKFDGQAMYKEKPNKRFVEATLVFEITDKKIELTESELMLIVDKVFFGNNVEQTKRELMKLFKD